MHMYGYTYRKFNIMIESLLVMELFCNLAEQWLVRQRLVLCFCLGSSQQPFLLPGLMSTDPCSHSMLVDTLVGWISSTTMPYNMNVACFVQTSIWHACTLAEYWPRYVRMPYQCTFHLVCMHWHSFN